MDGPPDIYVPWYRKSKDVQPYVLSTLLTSDAVEYNCTACFPWTLDSLETLWDGHAAQNAQLSGEWTEVVKQWVGAIAVGCKGRLIVLPKLATANQIVIRLSEVKAQIEHVTWGIDRNNPTRPLVIFTVTSVIVIVDVSSCMVVGTLRGHGGPITSVSVHPSQPHLFCTTSRDFSARIYDLSLFPVQAPNNPHWPPRPEPSLAGPAHGLHMREPEGEGIGQCVAVLIGGRSGGHRGAVSCSAFHPSQPMIATGGVDRAVKLWRIPPAVFSPPAQPRMAREDKPLFSTDSLHKARVQSVNWLADDILISRSAPAFMRSRPDDRTQTYYEEGTVVVWQWLGLNRFFPPGKVPQKIMRGSASDYRNSESFKILSAYHLPMITKHAHVFRSISHDPILLIPIGKVIRVFNISQFKPRIPAKYPADDLAFLTDRMALGEERRRRGSGSPSRRSDSEGSTSAIGEEAIEGSGREEGDAASRTKVTVYPPPAPLATLFDTVDAWEIQAAPSQGGPAIPDIVSCEVGPEGGLVIGIGKGALFVWRLQE
ncbi:WD40 repeat-like protein [Trametes elegans]|nr:WD40 repeat-like protein [Trametes elegans]